MSAPVWPQKIGSPPLWKHQLDALARSRSRAAYAFDFDPGLGKTGTVIVEAGRMFLDGDIDTLIVVAPNRVHRQWIEKAFPVWAGYLWKGFAWKGTGKAMAEFEAVMPLSQVKPALRVFTFNHEAVRRGGTLKRPTESSAMPLIERIFATSKRGVYVCYDESQRIKDPVAQQTRAALTLGRGVAKVRRKLSGTPILQGVQDLWSQYAFLDPKIIDERSWYTFRDAYCVTKPVPGGRVGAVQIVGSKNMDSLMAKIAPFTSRIRKEDALDMPEKLFDRFVVEMEPAQALAYAQMDRMMMAGLTSGEHAGTVVTAQIVLTQLQKLLQIASGFIHDDAGNPIWMWDSKVDAIVDKVSELEGEPCVIWAPFIPLLDRLEQKFGANGLRFRELDDVARWKAKGGVLIANPASGGVGVDGMQEVARRAYYAANGFHLEHRIQSIDRLHRGGQKSTCFYTDFVMKGTKDEAVLDVLAAKANVGNMTVEMLRKLLLAPSLPGVAA